MNRGAGPAVNLAHYVPHAFRCQWKRFDPGYLSRASTVRFRNPLGAAARRRYYEISFQLLVSFRFGLRYAVLRWVIPLSFPGADVVPETRRWGRSVRPDELGFRLVSLRDMEVEPKLFIVSPF